MTSTNQKSPNVERAIRDAKIAPFVNVAGLIVAGIFAAVAFLFKSHDDTGAVLVGMGLVIAAVAVVWSLFMSVRGFLKADRLGQLLVMVWLVWGELSVGSAILMFIHVRVANNAETGLSDFLGTTGLPTFLFLGWLVCTFTFPCAWWWMRHAFRRCSEQLGRCHKMVCFVWRVVVVAFIPVLLLLPFVLIVHVFNFGFTWPLKPWMITGQPAWVQRVGLKTSAWISSYKGIPGVLHPGIDHSYIRDEVLVDLLEEGGWYESEIVTILSGIKSQRFLVWLTAEVEKPSPPSRTFYLGINHAVQDYPVDTVRPFLTKILNSPAADRNAQPIQFALHKRSAEELKALRAEIQKLNKMSGADPTLGMALLSDASERDERIALWESFVTAPDPERRKAFVDIMAEIRFREGLSPFIERLLFDPQPGIQFATINALAADRPSWHLKSDTSWDVSIRVFDLTQDPNLAVRRKATELLCERAGLLSKIPLMKDVESDVPPETPTELAERKRIVSEARIRFFSNWPKKGYDPLKDPGIFRTVLRKQGDDHVHTYRIPGLITTPRGTLIAVFDIRHESAKDLPADIDVGAMRSTDHGQTWSPVQKVLDFEKNEPGSQGNGVGDPTILVDRKTGRIFVAALWSKGNRAFHGSGSGLTPEESGQFLLVRSDDDGVTWSNPINITAQVKDPTWRILFQGPGNGIQTRDGTLVFPAQFRGADGSVHSCFIYSTDGGEAWKTAPAAIPGKPPTSESQIVECADGSLLLSMRDESHSGKRAWAVYSWKDDIAKGSWGEPWSAVADPTCMASLISHPQGLLLFCNPASTKQRVALTVRASKDGGKTWAEGRLLDPRPCAYSCMTVLPDGQIGVLYECGEINAYEMLAFARFPLRYLGLGE